MFCYDYLIAGHRIRVTSPISIPNPYELENFQIPYKPDCTAALEYEIDFLPDHWIYEGERILSSGNTAVYRTAKEYHRYYYWSVLDRSKYVLLVIPVNFGGKYRILLQSDNLPDLLPKFRLSAFLTMEHGLARLGLFQLHASVIEWQGRGILFSAPSGTGKSTQAELWRQYENASVINGDRGIIQRQGKDYWVYGSPYAGTSGIYVNSGAPIAAIVTLSQAPYNRIQRLSVMEAFRSVYRETTVPAWDDASVGLISGVISDLVGRIPVYHLACRPDQDAVKTLKKVLSADS